MPSSANVKMNKKRITEKLLMSLRVLPILTIRSCKLSHYFASLNILNSLAALKASKTESSQLVAYFNAISIIDKRIITESKLLNLSLKQSLGPNATSLISISKLNIQKHNKLIISRTEDSESEIGYLSKHNPSVFRVIEANIKS